MKLKLIQRAVLLLMSLLTDLPSAAERRSSELVFVGRPLGTSGPLEVPIAPGIVIPNPSANSEPSLTGHAYVILKIPPQGYGPPREDVYGFYPKTGGKGLIKGPGELRAEQRCGPADDCSSPDFAKKLVAYEDSRVTVAVEITDAQRAAFLSAVRTWNSKNYDLVDSNCVNFVAEAARIAGIEPPPIDGLNRIPFNYVASLKLAAQKVNDERIAEKRRLEEMARREAEQRAQEERERQTREAEKRAQEERERQAREAADEARRRANIVPNGWVPCGCPVQHQHYGRFIGGRLYHPTGPVCDR